MKKLPGDHSLHQKKHGGILKKRSIKKTLDDYIKKANKPKVIMPLGNKRNDSSLSCNFIIVLDATGSQCVNWEIIQEGIEQVVNDISSISNTKIKLQIAMVAYRDYTSAKVIEFYDFTDDPALLKKFSKNIKCSGGADNNAEASEAGLHKARELLNNIPQKNKKIVALIGDEAAYGVKNSLEEKPDDGITWKKEIAEFKKMDVSIYSVFTGNHNRDREYFWQCANETNGKFFELANMADLSDFLTGVISLEAGKLENFEKILITSGRITHTKQKMLENLKKPILSLPMYNKK